MKSISSSFLIAAAAVALVLASAPCSSAQGASLTDLLGQLKSSASTSGDSTLKSLAGDLGSKATSLNQSLSGNPTAQSSLTSALQSLVGNQGGDSLASLQKLTQAKLTPEQTKLAKEVGQVGSAYLVQKNLGAVEGAQGDVAQIVKSLRKGSPTEALPAIQKVAQNAQLTPAQKDLLTSLADKYAPGSKKIGDALGEGLKSIPGFGK